MRTLRAALTFVLLAALQAERASAEQVDDATRGAARTLGYEGIAEYQAANYAVAAQKLDRAYTALKVPSLGLWSARAFEKTGRLVAASERYLEVIRLDASGGDLAVQRQAQADATREQSALEARIPTLVIVVEGAEGETLSVSVNGASMPASLLGAKRPVDPGNVKVEARAGSRQKVGELTLAEREHRTLTLTLDPIPQATPEAAPPAADQQGPAPVPHASAAPPVSAPAPSAAPLAVAPSQGSTKTLAFVAFGLSGAGLIVGGITGGMAATRIQDIDDLDVCRENQCPPSMQSEVDEYNTLRTLSTVGFGVGIGAAAAGVVLLLAAPNASTNAGRWRLSPWIGVGTAGLVGEIRR